MKKLTIILAGLLFFGLTYACVPPMFIQAQKNGQEVHYYGQLSKLLLNSTSDVIFRDVLTDRVNAKCYNYGSK